MDADQDTTYAVMGVGPCYETYEIIERSSDGDEVLSEVDGTGDPAKDARHVRGAIEDLMGGPP